MWRFPPSGYSGCGDWRECLGWRVWHTNSAHVTHWHTSPANRGCLPPSLRMAACCLSVEWVRQGNAYFEVCVCADVRSRRHCVILLALSGLSSIVLEVWGVRWCGEKIVQREKHEVRHGHSKSKLSSRGEPIGLGLPGLFSSSWCFLWMSFLPGACRRCHTLWTLLVDDSKLPQGCLELNPDPPKEQPVLMTIKPSLQPLSRLLNSVFPWESSLSACLSQTQVLQIPPSQGTPVFCLLF